MTKVKKKFFFLKHLRLKLKTRKIEITPETTAKTTTQKKGLLLIHLSGHKSFKTPNIHRLGRQQKSKIGW